MRRPRDGTGLLQIPIVSESVHAARPSRFADLQHTWLTSPLRQGVGPGCYDYGVAPLSRRSCPQRRQPNPA